MERLTETIENEDGIRGYSLIDCGNPTCGEICRLTRTGEKHDCDGCRIRKAINKLAEYEALEGQGQLLKLPCRTVWFICDKNTEFATVMSKPIRDLCIYEIEGIDKKGYYWSSEEKAEAELKRIKETR